MLLSDASLKNLTNGAIMEQQVCVEAQQLELELINVEDSDNEGDDQIDINGTIQSTKNDNMATADKVQWNDDRLKMTAI